MVDRTDIQNTQDIHALLFALGADVYVSDDDDAIRLNTESVEEFYQLNNLGDVPDNTGDILAALLEYVGNIPAEYFAEIRQRAEDDIDGFINSVVGRAHHGTQEPDIPTDNMLHGGSRSDGPEALPDNSETDNMLHRGSLSDDPATLPDSLGGLTDILTAAFQGSAADLPPNIRDRIQELKALEKLEEDSSLEQEELVTALAKELSEASSEEILKTIANLNDSINGLDPEIAKRILDMVGEEVLQQQGVDVPHDQTPGLNL